MSWRSLEFVTCAPEARCERRISTNGTELVGFIDDAVATSTDQGKTWKQIPDPEYAWSDHRGELFSWQGSLYQGWRKLKTFVDPVRPDGGSD